MSDSQESSVLKSESQEPSESQDHSESQEPSESQEQQENKVPKMDLLKMEITDERSALNLLIGFLGVAQKRGAFAINESSKIYEGIKQFIPKDT